MKKYIACSPQRVDMLQYICFKDLVKTALLCKEMYALIDPNRGTVNTDTMLTIRKWHKERPLSGSL